MGKEGEGSSGDGGGERGREKEEGDRQRGIPRAPSTQGDSSLRELGWVRPPNPFVHPPPRRPRPDEGGGGGDWSARIWGGYSGCWGRESFLGHFTSTSTEIERADIALDPRFKN